jgi:LPS sulfotransferase NodH
MKPLWLLLHAAASASTEQLFLLVTEPRSGSDWLVDLLDAHPNVCVPAGA